MWEMFDETIECDECGGVLGPPPKFTIPPPPRPPYLGEYSRTNCNEEEMLLKSQSWEGDICEAMPIFDASLYSSQSLQTSAIIAVFALLIVLVVLISSLFVWKNKRKVQNFLPCKTPTRGPHINGTLPHGGNHTLTYEDPDAHLGHHRPLVMRHHHNVEMLHGKAIHYPSGYPMTRSPPFLVSSSPGPDPYRSNDNVYEELGPGRESDGESDPPMHSDDDFAEDELSLPGERLFNKQNDMPNQILNTNVSAIYHERTPVLSSANTNSSNVCAPERNSVLSTSSASTQEASSTTAASLCSSHNNNQSINNNHAAGSSTAVRNNSSNNSHLPGILRHTTGRNKFHTANTSRARRNASSVDDFNASSSTTDANEIGPLQQMYDTRSNLMSLAYIPQQHQQTASNNRSTAHAYHSLHQSRNSNRNNSGPCNIGAASVQFYNTLENEVDRRNRMNAQLNNLPPVATIYRERINYPNNGRLNYPQPYYVSNSNNGPLAEAMRSRTVSRSMEHRHRVAAPAKKIETSYGYAEPVYHDNYHYDTCGAPNTLDSRLVQLPISAYASNQLMSDYTSAGSGYQHHPHHHPNQNQQLTTSLQACQGAHSQFYSRGGDSSFGSDSGYSHHTPASSIGRHDYDTTTALPLSATARTGNKESATSKISAALGFGWHRRKSTPTHNTPSSLKVNTAAQNQLYSNTAEATSPNNNSASSTITTTLENTSSASSASASGGSTASNNNSLPSQAIA